MSDSLKAKLRAQRAERLEQDSVIEQKHTEAKNAVRDLVALGFQFNEILANATVSPSYLETLFTAVGLKKLGIRRRVTVSNGGVSKTNTASGGSINSSSSSSNAPANINVRSSELFGAPRWMLDGDNFVLGISDTETESEQEKEPAIEVEHQTAQEDVLETEAMEETKQETKQETKIELDSKNEAEGDIKAEKKIELDTSITPGYEAQHQNDPSNENSIPSMDAKTVLSEKKRIEEEIRRCREKIEALQKSQQPQKMKSTEPAEPAESAKSAECVSQVDVMDTTEPNHINVIEPKVPEEPKEPEEVNQPAEMDGVEETNTTTTNEEALKAQIKHVQDEINAKKQAIAHSVVDSRAAQLVTIASRRGALVATKSKLRLAERQNKISNLEMLLRNEKQQYITAMKEGLSIDEQCIVLDKQAQTLREEMKQQAKETTPILVTSVNNRSSETENGTITQSKSSSSDSDIVQFPRAVDSPLRAFASFRNSQALSMEESLSPSFNAAFVNDLQNRIMCSYESSGAECVDKNCSSVHFSEFQVKPEKVLQFMATRYIDIDGYREQLISELEQLEQSGSSQAEYSAILAIIQRCQRQFSKERFLDTNFT